MVGGRSMTMAIAEVILAVAVHVALAVQALLRLLTHLG